MVHPIRTRATLATAFVGLLAVAAFSQGQQRDASSTDLMERFRARSIDAEKQGLA